MVALQFMKQSYFFIQFCRIIILRQVNKQFNILKNRFKIAQNHQLIKEHVFYLPLEGINFSFSVWGVEPD